MQIIRRNETPRQPPRGREKASHRIGTKEIRHYYLPQSTPLEIIETHIPPKTCEEVHAHRVIREATLVLKGKVIVAEIARGKRNLDYELSSGNPVDYREMGSAEIADDTLLPGDLAVFDPCSCHVMENRDETKWAVTLTFKFLGEGKDIELFLNDKKKRCSDPLPGTRDPSVN